MDGWQYSTDGGTSWADIAGSDGSTRSAAVTKLSSSTGTSLSNGASYTLKVRAVNDKGDGAASAGVTEPTLPLIPATLTASGGDGQVALTWSKSPSDATVTGWVYQYKTTGSYGSWTDVPNSTGSTTSHTVTGLDNSATYTFRLWADNDAGGGPSREASASTVPAKPTGLSLTAGFEKITLSWTNPAGGATVTGNAYRYKPQGQRRRRLHRLDGHIRRRKDLPAGHGADQRRAVHLPGAGGERDRRRDAVGRGVGPPVPRRAHGPVGRAG